MIAYVRCVRSSVSTPASSLRICGEVAEDSDESPEVIAGRLRDLCFLNRSTKDCGGHRVVKHATGGVAVEQLSRRTVVETVDGLLDLEGVDLPIVPILKRALEFPEFCR